MFNLKLSTELEENEKPELKKSSLLNRWIHTTPQSKVLVHPKTQHKSRGGRGGEGGRTGQKIGQHADLA